MERNTTLLTILQVPTLLVSLISAIGALIGALGTRPRVRAAAEPGSRPDFRFRT